MLFLLFLLVFFLFLGDWILFLLCVLFFFVGGLLFLLSFFLLLGTLLSELPSSFRIAVLLVIGILLAFFLKIFVGEVAGGALAVPARRWLLLHHRGGVGGGGNIVVRAEDGDRHL